MKSTLYKIIDIFFTFLFGSYIYFIEYLKRNKAVDFCTVPKQNFLIYYYVVCCTTQNNISK